MEHAIEQRDLRLPRRLAWPEGAIGAREDVPNQGTHWLRCASFPPFPVSQAGRGDKGLERFTEER